MAVHGVLPAAGVDRCLKLAHCCRGFQGGCLTPRNVGCPSPRE
jgi:hypothetical protein